MGNGLGDTHLDGWTDPSEPAATFPPKTIPVSPLNDFEIWKGETRGWRKMEAAVLGGAAVTSGAGQAYAASRVDVGSVVEAARAFQATQDLLIWLNQTIRTAVQSMVGDDKAWKGPAATKFDDRMSKYADSLGAQAEHFAGGKVADSTTASNEINSSTNAHSLPSQLYDAANYLSWAQQSIAYLDSAWATIAGDNGVGEGGGPVPISGSEFEKPMAEQMASVLGTVAEQYKTATDKAGPLPIMDPFTPATPQGPGNQTTPKPPTTPTPPTTPVTSKFTLPTQPTSPITMPTTPPHITVAPTPPPNPGGGGGITTPPMITTPKGVTMPGGGNGPGANSFAAVTTPAFKGPGEIGGVKPPAGIGSGGGGGGGGL